MRVRTHEEMFRDVDKNGQFIPGVKPPEKAYKTFRQAFEGEMEKGLSEFTEISYFNIPSSTLSGAVKELFTNTRDREMDQRFFGKLRDIVSVSLSGIGFQFRQGAVYSNPAYIGEFPLAYYENERYTKVDEAGRRHSTAMDIFYILSLEIKGLNLWAPSGSYQLMKIQEAREQLESAKPGFLAGKKKRQYYEREKARAEERIADLKRAYIAYGGGMNSTLFDIRLIRLWALHEGEPKDPEARKVWRVLLENLNYCEELFIQAIERVTAFERDLGIENDTIFTCKEVRKDDNDDDWDDGWDD